MARMLIGLMLIATVSSGCLWAPELDRVRKEIEHQMPGTEFHREFALSLGPVSMALLRTAAALAPVEDEERAYLKEISKVKVAVYEADNVPADANLEVPDRLQHLIDGKGWEVAVKTRDDGQSVWVLYKATDDEIREMYVVVMDDRELVLLRAAGHLDRLFEKAMNEHLDIQSDLGL